MEAAKTPDQAYISKTRIGVLAVSSMGMAALAITPSYNAIAKSFALSATAVQMLTSLPNLFMMLAGLLMGKLTAGKIKLKNLTVIMMILCCAGGLLPLVYHGSFAFLLVCSCLVGLGQGACTNLSQVLIARMLPASERQSTMGLTTTFTNLGGIVFIMGGGWLSSMSGWVANYWIYLFAVLVLVTVLALVPLNPLPVDDGASIPTGGKIKLNKYVFVCAGWSFCTMLLNNVLNNNISLFIAQEKLGSTAQAALISTISLVGGMLCGFVVGQIGKKFPHSSIALAFFLYGLAYVFIGVCHNLIGIFIGSFIVGAAMSVAMGQFAYMISIVVDQQSTSMALGVYQAINPIGGVISPFVVNGLTSVTHMNAFTVSGILALVLAAAALGSGFQKHLLAYAQESQA
ncbi:MFS transporter [Lactobacillus nasalidis]|uniref:MFS transporter n=1 Tax=Lactobacillus nasalidis TaxID=2797258 RepID=A0ABQ3W952_9LACO|nr:MFS transporter [Lactobacillus nasalidis]GHV97946.1 MFS transporter [Lactobacillus nasalidis]GHV99664.1 MFS transporter [Lactobacillus nasalidis]GHW02046.1 MFS transporter [Lactobacillus nasalidis]